MPTASTTGWCPLAHRTPSQNFWPGHQGRKAVVLHIAQGSFASAVSWLRAPASQASSHFVISKAGQIAQLVSIDDSAWANGLTWNARLRQWVNPNGHAVVPSWPGLSVPTNPNWQTISIEHEGRFQEQWTDAMREANIALLRWIRQQTQIVYRPHETLIGHYEINPVDRPDCPGPHVDYVRIAKAANAPDEAALRARWGPTYPFHPDWAIPAAWSARADELGAPQSYETPIGSEGLVVQRFEHGLGFWWPEAPGSVRTFEELK